MRTHKASARRVEAILVENGYVRIPPPLVVGGILFEAFPFLTRPNSQELVILAAGRLAVEKEWVREIDAVARALDAIQSTRSLTTVTFDASVDAIVTVRDVSRVLPVTHTDFDNEAILYRKLSILMPLVLPEAIGPTQITLEVEEVVSSELLGGPLQQLVRASGDGAKSVEAEMIGLFQSAWDKT